jgi:hypothetical protein
VSNKTDKYILNILVVESVFNFTKIRFVPSNVDHSLLWHTVEILNMSLSFKYCKYQLSNKTDKYILNILEHTHLQYTMLTFLQIFIYTYIENLIKRYTLQIKCKIPLFRMYLSVLLLSWYLQCSHVNIEN